VTGWVIQCARARTRGTRSRFARVRFATVAHSPAVAVLRFLTYYEAESDPVAVPAGEALLELQREARQRVTG